MSARQRSGLCRDWQHALLVEYEAESFGDPDPTWQGTTPSSKQSRATEAIAFANLALWLVKPTPTRSEFLVHVDVRDHEVTLRHLATLKRVHCHRLDDQSRLGREDLKLGRELNEAITALDRASALWLPVWHLWNGVCESDWSVRYVLFWIVLEGLFGPEGGERISRRTSRRLSHFLETDRTLQGPLSKSTLKAYRLRSKLVHGKRPTRLTSEASDLHLYEVENLCRRAFLKILREEALTRTFADTKQRDRYLESLSGREPYYLRLRDWITSFPLPR